MTLNDLVVRRATPADASRIQQLYVQLTQDSRVNVDPSHIADLTYDTTTTLLVCDYLGEVCATALVSVCNDVMYGRQPFAVVENVVVDDAMRGMGIGGLLLDHVEATCLASNCSKIMLMSSSHRHDAHRFFESSGYTGDLKRGFVKYRREMSLRIDTAHAEELEEI